LHLSLGGGAGEKMGLRFHCPPKKSGEPWRGKTFYLHSDAVKRGDNKKKKESTSQGFAAGEGGRGGSTAKRNKRTKGKERICEKKKKKKRTIYDAETATEKYKGLIKGRDDPKDRERNREHFGWGRRFFRKEGAPTLRGQGKSLFLEGGRGGGRDKCTLTG